MYIKAFYPVFDDESMQNRWVGKKIDFVLLGDYVEAFFKNKGFSSKREETSDGFNVAIGPPDLSENGAFAIVVKVVGKPEDFVVEFETGEASRAASIFGPLAALLGGGGLLLRRLKSEDKLRELEKDFWAYLGERLALF